MLGPPAGFRLDRIPPAADVGGLVERHWLVSWDLPPGELSSVTLLPHPCVNLVYDGRLAVAGVGRERFTYPLTGRGQVFGVKFRPGGFAPFFGGEVGEITGRHLPAEQVWPAADVTRLEHELAAAGDPTAQVEAVEEFLRRHWPEPDPTVELVGRIARALLRDRSVTRVEDVSRRYAMSPRALQRLFRRYVGVPPKWVLQRYRLHEAAARLAEQVGGAAEVAADLGYFDQSHFIRDFTAAVGLTPAQYAAACAEGRAPVPV